MLHITDDDHASIGS